MRIYHWLTVVLILFFLSFLTGCGEGGGSSSEDIGLATTSESDSTGTLMLSLTDAPGDYQAVYVTIEDVTACLVSSENVAVSSLNDENCEWVSLTEEKGTYDLLKLRDGVTETLGITDLPAGTYYQLRMLIGETPESDDHPYANYLYLEGNPEPIELKVPSGIKSGIKIVHPFNVVDRRFKELILDFDAEKSLVKAGNSGKFNLKPTIKVKEVQNFSIISGRVVKTVIDSEAGDAIEGARVYAYISENGSYTETASYVTNEDGVYYLPVENNASLTIVAVAPTSYGSLFLTEDVTTGYETEETIDFEFELPDEILTGGLVLRITGSTTPLYGVELSLDLMVDLGSLGIIEVEAFSNPSFTIDEALSLNFPVVIAPLPVGSYVYTVGASGHGPVSSSIGISANTNPDNYPQIAITLSQSSN